MARSLSHERTRRLGGESRYPYRDEAAAARDTRHAADIA
jgi:hypothetical protein